MVSSLATCLVALAARLGTASTMRALASTVTAPRVSAARLRLPGLWFSNMILKGKSQKGKNRVHELGEEWTLIRTVPTVLFDSSPGPWAMIVPISDPDKGRWINLNNDKDFVIVSN